MKRHFRRLFDVRREELPQLFPLFLNYFLLVLTSYILKSASSGLFLNKVGVGELPYAYILIAVAAALVAYLLGRLSTHISLTRLILGTQWFLVGNMLLFWWLLRFTTWIWPYYAFLVWMKVFSVLTVSQFWIFANNLFDARQAKRLFGLLNLGGVVGAMLGGTFTLLFVRALLAENLLLCAAIVMVLGSGAFWYAARREAAVQARVSAPEVGKFRAPEKFRALEMLRLTVQNRHLLVISAIISIAGIVGKFVEFQFFGMAQATYPNKEDLTAFLGGFLGLYVNLVTFTVQFFLTGAVLRTLGVGGALQLTPAAVMVGAVGVLAWPGIWTASALRMIEAGCRYTLNKTGLEVLYLPIPPQIKNRTKLFLDMVVDRVSGGLAGVLLVFCTSVFLLNVRQIGIVTMIFAALWLLLAGYALQEYVRTIRKGLEKRGMHLESVTVPVSDVVTIRVLSQALDSSNPRQVLYALGLLEQIPSVSLADRLPGLVHHPSSEVQGATLRFLAGRGDRSALAAAQQFLQQGNLDLRTQAVRYLCRFDPNPLDKLQGFLDHPDLEVRLAALLTAEEYPDARFLPAISAGWIRALWSWPEPEAEKARALVAYALPRADPQSVPVRELLLRLLEDSDPAVQKEALKAAGKIQDPELIPVLIGKLAMRATRGGAREALARYGPGILDTLGNRLGDPHEPEGVRQAIPRLLGQLASPEAAKLLVAHLSHSTLAMRFQILKALNRIRREHPEVHIPGDVIDREIFEEARRYYRLLFSVQGDKADPGPGRELLIGTLEERLDQTLERIFRLFGLRYPPKEVYDAYLEVRSKRSRRRAAALEFLDNTLDRSHKRVIMPLLEESAWDVLQPLGKELFGFEPLNTEQCLRELIQSNDRWVKIVALYRAAELGLRSLKPEMQTATSDPDRLVVETATLALGRLTAQPT